MKKHKKLILAVLCAAGAVLAAVLVWRLCFCGGTGNVSANLSAYGETPITISGLQDEDFTVTADELSLLPCTSVTAQGATEKAGTVTGQGPTLETFLSQYGRSVSDFKKIRFYCADGYKVVLRDEYLTDYEIVLAVCRGRQTLPEAQRPLRVIIPEADSGMWAYAVTKIEFVPADG